MTHQRRYGDVNAAGNNDTAVNSMAQELVCGGEIKIRLIILVGRLIEINYVEEMQHQLERYKSAMRLMAI